MVRVGYKIDGVMWSLCLFLSYTLFIQVKNKKDEKMWDIIQKIKNILLTAIVLLAIFYLPLYASTFKDGKNSIVVGISGGIQRVIFHDYASFTDIFKQPFLSTSIGYQRDTQTSAAKASLAYTGGWINAALVDSQTNINNSFHSLDIVMDFIIKPKPYIHPYLGFGTGYTFFNLADIQHYNNLSLLFRLGFLFPLNSWLSIDFGIQARMLVDMTNNKSNANVIANDFGKEFYNDGMLLFLAQVYVGIAMKF